MENLPKYYDVDGTLVIVDKDSETQEVFGKTSAGADYPPVKAAAEGVEITQEDFEERSKNNS